MSLHPSPGSGNRSAASAAAAVPPLPPRPPAPPDPPSRARFDAASTTVNAGPALKTDPTGPSGRGIVEAGIVAAARATRSTGFDS